MRAVPRGWCCSLGDAWENGEMIYYGVPIEYVPDTAMTPERAQSSLIYYVVHVLIDEAALRFGPDKATA